MNVRHWIAIVAMVLTVSGAALRLASKAGGLTTAVEYQAKATDLNTKAINDLRTEFVQSQMNSAEELGKIREQVSEARSRIRMLEMLAGLEVERD